MGKSLSTTFTQANGAPAQIVGGPAWETISGATPTVTSNELVFSTAGSLNPIFGVTVGLRMNGQNDVDCSMRPDHVYGNALYVRVVDANNWIRARVDTYETSYQYYLTEYEWYDYDWLDRYQARTLEYEYSQTTTTYSCTYSAWSGWSNCGFTETGCRDGPQATNPSENSGTTGTGCNQDIKQYRVIQTNQTGCSGGRWHYQQQCRTRTETRSASTSTSYQWSSASSLAGWTKTGNTRYSNAGLYHKTGTNQSTTSNPGQTTTADSPNDLYEMTYAAYQGNTNWGYSNTTPPEGPDQLVPGSTRQTGPWTGYNQHYGRITLEKCVAGSVSSFGSGSYLHGSSTPQTLRLRAKGSAIEVYYAGTLRITATDSTFATTGTKIGVGGATSSYNPTAARVDDFAYTILTPYKVRNAAGTAWVDVEQPKIFSGGAWVDYDPKKY